MLSDDENQVVKTQESRPWMFRAKLLKWKQGSYHGPNLHLVSIMGFGIGERFSCRSCKTFPANALFRKQQKVCLHFSFNFLLQAVITCIQNKDYEHASKILREHMSQDPNCKQMSVILNHIIRKKNPSHPAICNLSCKVFQQRIFLVFKSYLDDSEPFLLVVSVAFQASLVLMSLI
uniref:Uncharacterized protein n=1 Tax=Pseudonaja textilis TaxID=8673 RepID=A0A670ZK84_PSETE